MGESSEDDEIGYIEASGSRKDKRDDILISLLAAVMVAGFITLFIFVPMYFWSTPMGEYRESTEETDEIIHGGYARWPIETSEYRIRYSVKVIEGGNVDVFVTKAQTVDGEREHVPVSNHIHRDVDEAEGIVLAPEKAFDSYLVVDNSEALEAQPEGNVTVRITMEHHEKIPVQWIKWGGTTIFTIMLIGFMWSTWGRKGKGGPTEGVDQRES